MRLISLLFLHVVVGTRGKLASAEDRRRRAERAKGDVQRALAAAGDANRYEALQERVVEGVLGAAFPYPKKNIWLFLPSRRRRSLGCMYGGQAGFTLVPVLVGSSVQEKICCSVGMKAGVVRVCVADPRRSQGGRNPTRDVW